MDLKPGLKNLTERYQAQSEKKISEQQTIISYVLPFLRYLGYDTSDQNQFRAEYSVKIGAKNFWVDLAVLDQTPPQPIIFIECKSLDSKLQDGDREQLSSYCNMRKSVKFGILTNGYEYQFYTDLDHKNVLDEQPFLLFNLETDTNEYIEHLSTFTRQNFDAAEAHLLAERLSYRPKVLDYFERERKNPSDELARLIAKHAIGELGKAKKKDIWSKIKSILPEILSELLGSGDVNGDKVIDSSKPMVPVTETDPVESESEVETEAVSIFDSESPERKYIEYFIFEDECLDQYNKIVDMYVYVFEKLFERDKNCVLNFKNSPVHTSKPSYGSYETLKEDCYLWKNYSNERKFTHLKNLLAAFQMDKNALRVKLRDK